MKNPNINTNAPATLAGPYRRCGPSLFKVQTFGRKAFNGYILDLYGQSTENLFAGDALAADRTFGDDVYLTEVFNAPDGLLIAFHEMHVTHVLRPATILKDDLTGRDAFIIGKALLTAIDVIQHLPRERQAWSDMRDMCTLARSVHGAVLASQMAAFEVKSGRELDLWPGETDRLAANDNRERVDALKKTYRESQSEGTVVEEPTTPEDDLGTTEAGA